MAAQPAKKRARAGGPLWRFGGGGGGAVATAAQVFGGGAAAAAAAAECREHDRAHRPWRIVASLSEEEHPHDALRVLGYRVLQRCVAPVQQNTAAWLEARTTCYLTASAAARTYGGGHYNGARGPVHFLNTKLNFGETMGHVDSVGTLRGHLGEPYVRHAMRGVKAWSRDPAALPLDLEMRDGGFVWIELLRTKGPDVATLWRHPFTHKPWPMRIGASVDVRVFAVEYRTMPDGSVVRQQAVEVASGEIKYPSGKMYEADRDHVQPVHERGTVAAEAPGSWTPADEEGFSDVTLPAKTEYLSQQAVQMAVQAVPASLHVVLFPGRKEAPDAREGYATAHVLHFSPTLFDAVVTCAARMRLIETVYSGATIHRALHEHRPYSAAKRVYDADAAAAGAVAPTRNGWRPEMAFEGAYTFALPRSMWERVAVESAAGPLRDFLGDDGYRVGTDLAHRTGMPAAAIALAHHTDERNALFLPHALRASGWPRMDARLHAHVKAVHDAELADADFWRRDGALGLLPPRGDGLDGPWVDEEPAQAGGGAAATDTR